MFIITTFNIIPAEISPNSKETETATAKLKELENKLIIAQKKRPFSKKATTTFTPNLKLTYDPTSKIMSLASPIQKKIHDVVSYKLSPRKKYLIIHQETIEGATTRIMGEFFGKLGKRTQILLINPRTGELITSFDVGKLLTYAMDPSEDLLLIARPKKSWNAPFGKNKPSNVHASSVSGFREPSATGAILQYEIFDLTSQQKNISIKTIENVQAIQFNKSHELLVRYDDETIEKIKFQRNTSFFSKIINTIMPSYFTTKWNIILSTPTETEKENLIGTMYDEKHKTLKLTIPELKETKDFKKINSYHLSPQINFIMIDSPVTGIIATQKKISGASEDTDTTFIDLQHDVKNKTFSNVISYEWNHDETRLIIFCTQIGLFGADSKPTYQLFDTLSQKLLKTFENIHFAYFDKTDKVQAEKLILIDEQGKIITCDPHSGISYAEIEKLQEKESSNFKQEFAKKKYDLEENEMPTTNDNNLFTAITQKAYSLAENIRQYWMPKPAQTIMPNKEQEKQQTSPSSTSQNLPKKEKVEKKDDDDISEQYEDIRFLMPEFIKNKNMEHMDKIISEFYINTADDVSERNYFINAFNLYDMATKKDFASLFFAKPAGNLNTTGISVSSHESKDFAATIINDTIWIKKKNAGRNISIKDDLDYETSCLLFDTTEKYFIVSYNTANKAIIDIFINQKGVFLFSSTITPADFNTIIGLRFINTKDNNFYLFFIDKNYKIGLYDLQNQTLLTSKQQELSSETMITEQSVPPISPGIPIEPINTSTPASSTPEQPGKNIQESSLEKETIDFCNKLLKFATELGIDQSRRERLENILTKDFWLIEREFLELAKDILHAKISTYEELIEKIKNAYSPETISKYRAIVSKIKSNEIPTLKAANLTLQAVSNLENLAERLEQREKTEEEKKL
jgi:hypothetical protein